LTDFPPAPGKKSETGLDLEPRSAKILSSFGAIVEGAPEIGSLRDDCLRESGPRRRLRPTAGM